MVIARGSLKLFGNACFPVANVGENFLNPVTEAFNSKDTLVRLDYTISYRTVVMQS